MIALSKTEIKTHLHNINKIEEKNKFQKFWLQKCHKR